MAKKKSPQRSRKAPNPEMASMAAKKLLCVDNPSSEETAFITLMIESARRFGPTPEEVAEVFSAGTTFPEAKPGLEKILALKATKEFMETSVYQTVLLDSSQSGKEPTLPLIGRMLHVYPQDYGNIMAFPLEVSLASGKTLLQNTKEEAARAADKGALGVIYLVGIPLLRNNIVLAIVVDAQGEETTLCVSEKGWLELSDPLAADKLDNIARQAARARLNADRHGDTQNVVNVFLQAESAAQGKGRVLSAEQVDTLREASCDAVREVQLISYLALQSTINANASQKQVLEQQLASTTAELKAKIKQRDRENDQLQTRIKTLERRLQLLSEEKTDAQTRAVSNGAANDAAMVPIEQRLAAIFL